MINSVQNTKIKWVRSLQTDSRSRRQEGLFVVEGVRLVEEAIASGWSTQLVLYTPQPSPRTLAIIDGYASQQAAIEQVSESVMRSISDTETPQGILVVLEKKRLEPCKPLDFAFIPDGVRDPGNLGTILRTAAAAGVQVVFQPTGGVDPFSPKVVRAGMGAHFRLPILTIDWSEIMTQVSGLQLFLGAAGSGIPYTKANFCSPLAIIVGGEAQGAGEQAQSLPVIPIHISMPGEMESLNAAVAASILFFEVVRQRAEITHQ